MPGPRRATLLNMTSGLTPIDELAALADAGVAFETSEPSIAFELGVGGQALATRLRNAPCPVIGVGEADHPFASACDIVLSDAHELPLIRANIRKAPLAAMVLVQHLRSSEQLDVEPAIVSESLAFATVQRGAEFLAWRAGAPVTPPPPSRGDAIVCDVNEDRIGIELARPETRNAINVEMRDALVEILEAALADGARPILLTARGKCFSTGGAVWEFGEAADPATAHRIRMTRSPALCLARLAPRLTVRVQGAAIGAGVELAAFGSRLTATPDAWFQLPELRYGLIPGAGGTVSIARRIGRRRVAYMALSMRRISAASALDWGLVDAIER